MSLIVIFTTSYRWILLLFERTLNLQHMARNVFGFVWVYRVLVLSRGDFESIAA